MTKKYERQCWYCKSRDLEDKGDYAQCRSCGATWNEVPTMGIPPMIEVHDKSEMVSASSLPSRYRPHGALLQSVERKRGQKVEPDMER